MKYVFKNLSFSQFNNLLPILISILIMTLVSAISVSALSTKRQLKNYAVYYICGLKWKQCSLINLVSCTSIAFISIIIAGFCTIVLKNTFFSESVLELGILQIFICINISFLYIVLSALLPLKIIKNNTPREVLKSN